MNPILIGYLVWWFCSRVAFMAFLIGSDGENAMKSEHESILLIPFFGDLAILGITLITFVEILRIQKRIVRLVDFILSILWLPITLGKWFGSFLRRHHVLDAFSNERVRNVGRRSLD